MRALVRAATAILFVLSCLTEAESEPIATDYQVVHGWPIMPEGHMLGQATGVGVDSHNHVFVYHRAGREWGFPPPDEPIQFPTIAIFDGDTGEQIGSWGAAQFVLPHGLTVDDRDNVWLTDVGSHQVHKFTHDGELLLTLGTHREHGNDTSHFTLPTDVATLPSGDFYVSDGYGNTRIMKYSAKGEFQFQWGTKGSAPGEFDLPHGVAVDADGRVYVADRANSRIQVFDGSGSYIDQWKSPELDRPYAIAIGHDGHAYIVDGGDQLEVPPDRSRAIRLSLQGEIEATFGSFGPYDGQFRLGHDIAVGKDGAVYVVDAWGNRVQKFISK